MEPDVKQMIENQQILEQIRDEETKEWIRANIIPEIRDRAKTIAKENKETKEIKNNFPISFTVTPIKETMNHSFFNREYVNQQLGNCGYEFTDDNSNWIQGNIKGYIRFNVLPKIIRCEVCDIPIVRWKHDQTLEHQKLVNLENKEDNNEYYYQLFKLNRPKAHQLYKQWKFVIKNKNKPIPSWISNTILEQTEIDSEEEL